jgi:hypothetical protein
MRPGRGAEGGRPVDRGSLSETRVTREATRRGGGEDFALVLFVFVLAALSHTINRPFLARALLLLHLSSQIHSFFTPPSQRVRLVHKHSGFLWSPFIHSTALRSKALICPQLISRRTRGPYLHLAIPLNVLVFLFREDVLK